MITANAHISLTKQTIEIMKKNGTNRMPSNREIALSDKESIKPEIVCKFKCTATPEGRRSYELMATTSERLEIQKAIHADSYGGKKVVFSEAESI